MTFIIAAKKSEWYAIFASISTLVDEATLEISEEQINFRGMDPSHIALIDINYLQSSFTKFEVSESAKFGVRVDEVIKIIKRFEKDDEITLRLGDDSMLHILKDKKVFRSRLVETSASSTPLPKLNFHTKVELAWSTLDKIMGDAQVTSEYIRFESAANKVKFYGRGDSGEYESTLEPGNEGLVSLEIKEDAKATYSLDYLSKQVKAMAEYGGTIKIEYSSKMPCRLNFADNKISFYLAPRVQD